MKNLLYGAIAALLVSGVTNAQTVSVIGLDGSKIATFELDEVNQLVFAPGENEDPKEDENVVYNQTVTGTAPLTNDYAPIEMAINATEIASALGISSMDEATFVLQEPNGNIVSSYTANYGYYIAADGYCGSWNEGSPFYIEYIPSENPSVLNVGQFTCTANTVYKATVGFMVGQKLALIAVEYSVTD